jgi:putative hemolysin
LTTLLAPATATQPVPGFDRAQGAFRVRFARSPEEIEAAMRLRYEVFNRELGEGLEASHATGLDEDRFDAVCHHLLVEERTLGKTVGTYRMQSYPMASRNHGFYSAGEFQLASLPGEVLSLSVEIGRACIAREHRNRQVLLLLWQGLAAYMQWSGMRYLFGCSSLTSQDPADGLQALAQLRAAGHVHPSFRVDPHPALDCRLVPAPRAGARAVKIPILFFTYLRYGAKVLGPPALDRQFKTIDFLTLLDIEILPRDLRRLFFTQEAIGTVGTLP